jgi:hypothetical protein
MLIYNTKERHLYTQKQTLVMNIKQATIAGLITYFIIFIMGSILLFGLGITMNLFGLIMLLIMPFGIFIVAKYLYFNRVKVRQRIEGLYLGIYWLVIAILLDIIILVYGFNIGWNYFLKANWTMPVGYAEYVIFAFLAGYFSKMHHKFKKEK